MSVQVRQVKVIELASSVAMSTLRASSVVLQTESDMATVSGACEDSSTSLNLTDDAQSIRSGRSSAMSKVFSWDVTSPVVLAVKYRLSTFMVIKLQTRSGGLKKKTNVWAIGMLKLGDIPDGETLDVGVPSASPHLGRFLWTADSDPEVCCGVLSLLDLRRQ